MNNKWVALIAAGGAIAGGTIIGTGYLGANVQREILDKEAIIQEASAPYLIGKSSFTPEKKHELAQISDFFSRAPELLMSETPIEAKRIEFMQAALAYLARCPRPDAKNCMMLIPALQNDPPMAR